jgi:hypothetical protein
MQEHFIIYVMQATNLPPKKEGSGGYDSMVKVKLNFDKKKRELRTKSVKKDLNPNFSQFFYLECAPTSITLSVCKDNYSEAFLGQIELKDLAAIPRDLVIEKVLPLTEDPKKKSKKPVSGQLKIRMYYSSLPDRSTLLKSGERNFYFYKNYAHLFKTGDLLLYSGNGITAALTKLTTGTPFSHCGIVVKLANKWTKEEELYVIESSSNMEDFRDAFKEEKGAGMKIYRLFERLHQFFGSGIWWSSLKNHVDPAKAEEGVQWLWREYMRQEIDLRLVENALEDSMRATLADFLIETKKNSAPLCDIRSAEVATRFYKMLGLLSESVEASRTALLDIVNFPFFNPPILLRTAERTREDYLRGQNTFVPVETQLQHSPSTLQYFGQTPQSVIAPAPGAVGPDMMAPVNGMAPVSGHVPQQPGFVPHGSSSPHMVAPVSDPFAPVPHVMSSPMMMQHSPRAISPQGDAGHVIQPIVVPAQLSNNSSGEIPRSGSGSLLTYTDQRGVQQQIEVPQLNGAAPLGGTPPQQPYVVLIPSPRQERRARTPDKRKEKGPRSDQLNKEHEGHHRRTSSLEHVTVRRARDRKVGSSAEISPRSNDLGGSSDNTQQ